MKQETEIWRDIQGYEGLYQISSMGRVKSLNYGRTGKEGILKQRITKNGYLYVTFYKEGKEKNFYIHRLVATAFIPNLENLLEVNHKDENKQNNCVDNLEFCIHQYNVNYGTRNERHSKSLKGRKLPQEQIEKRIKKSQKPILQLTKDGEFIKKWLSIKQASIELKISNGNISRCCQSQLKTYKGFKWGYVDDYEKLQFNVFDLNIYVKKAS